MTTNRQGYLIIAVVESPVAKVAHAQNLDFRWFSVSWYRHMGCTQPERQAFIPNAYRQAKPCDSRTCEPEGSVWQADEIRAPRDSRIPPHKKSFGV